MVIFHFIYTSMVMWYAGVLWYTSKVYKLQSSYHRILDESRAVWILILAYWIMSAVLKSHLCGCHGCLYCSCDLRPWANSVILIKDKIPQLPQACLMAQPKMGTVLYDTECLTTWSLTLTVYYWNSATNMSLKKLWFFQFTGLNFNQLENKMSSWL